MNPSEFEPLPKIYQGRLDYRVRLIKAGLLDFVGTTVFNIRPQLMRIVACPPGVLRICAILIRDRNVLHTPTDASTFTQMATTINTGDIVSPMDKIRIIGETLRPLGDVTGRLLLDFPTDYIEVQFKGPVCGTEPDEGKSFLHWEQR